jgi:hypothetical protein
MVRFFFYNNLTNLELIKKINNNFEIDDGYIIVKKFDSENNILEISDKSLNADKLLYGKIVNFDMKLYDIIQKLNDIDECKIKNKINYTLETILVNKTFGGICEAYIIY